MDAATLPGRDPLSFGLLAACQGADLDVFYGYRVEQGWDTRYQSYCDECMVRRPCLDYALAHAEWGVWGGLTEAERDRIRPRQLRSRRPESSHVG
jgi:Transcription factor WhiB